MNHLLLVVVGTTLLLQALFAQLHKVGVVDLIIINLAKRNLDGAGCHIIDKGPVVTHKQQGATAGLEKVLEPLYRLNIEMIGRLIEKQHVGTLQQQLCNLHTHAPATTELAGWPRKIAALKAQTQQGLL